MATATIKQLAIALNLTVEAMKSQFIATAQESGNFEYADEISNWQPETPIPDELRDIAEKHGLNISRKRKPSGRVNGGLANPSQVVSAFLEQVPQLIQNSLSLEQQAFVNESKFAGKMTGVAGALAFQQELVAGFTQANDQFRQARSNGLQNLQAGVGAEFNGLFEKLCDSNRALEAANEKIIAGHQQFDSILSEMDAVFAGKSIDDDAVK